MPVLSLLVPLNEELESIVLVLAGGSTLVSGVGCYSSPMKNHQLLLVDLSVSEGHATVGIHSQGQMPLWMILYPPSKVLSRCRIGAVADMI